MRAANKQSQHTPESCELRKIQKRLRDDGTLEVSLQDRAGCTAGFVGHTPSQPSKRAKRSQLPTSCCASKKLVAHQPWHNLSCSYSVYNTRMNVYNTSLATITIICALMKPWISTILWRKYASELTLSFPRVSTESYKERPCKKKLQGPLQCGLEPSECEAEWVAWWQPFLHQDALRPGGKRESSLACSVWATAGRSCCEVKAFRLSKWSLRWIVLFETSNLTPVCLQSLVYTPAYNLSSAFDSSQHLCPFSRPPCMVFIHESFKSFVFVLTFLPSKLFLLWCTPCWMLWQPERAVF